jgi:L-2,4-diaminobutyrate decarboxylase
MVAPAGAESRFPTWGGPDSDTYRQAVLGALDALRLASEARGDRPLLPASPADLSDLVSRIDVFPPQGRPLNEVIGDLGVMVAGHSVDVTHPACMAHLHCRPLTAALAAEVMIAALNQSMDSWDQAPVATHIEQHVVAALAAQTGFEGERAGGMFTSGGTQSNLMGLMLARDHAARRRGAEVGREGLPADAHRYRILCSAAAHFSVNRSAAVLGLGTDAVCPIPVDEAGAIDVPALGDTLARMGEGDDLVPMAIVATVGTTSHGAVDRVEPIVALARRHRCWLHVDASYGGALLFSPRYRGLLDGLSAADSVALDFHKLLWQPLSCGVFLVRRQQELATLEYRADYLNPEDDEMADMPSLVGDSPLLTSRRFDALKVLMSFQAVGREAMGEMVDRTIELAAYAAEAIAAEPTLELERAPSLGIVVFRCLPPAGPVDAAVEVMVANALNESLRRDLLTGGVAVIGRTEVGGMTFLKLTLLNPRTTESDIDRLVQTVVDAAHARRERHG